MNSFSFFMPGSLDPKRTLLASACSTLVIMTRPRRMSRLSPAEPCTGRSRSIVSGETMAGLMKRRKMKPPML